MIRKLIPLGLLFLASLPTLGQKTEVFGGYQLTHFDGGPTSNGWNAAVTGNFLPFLGVTADFSGVYNSGTHFYTYTFGPEVHARALGVKPFAHALFGGGTFSGGGVNSTGFTTYLGGGVDVKILPFVSARLTQVDWMTTRFSGVTFSTRTPQSGHRTRYTSITTVVAQPTLLQKSPSNLQSYEFSRRAVKFAGVGTEGT